MPTVARFIRVLPDEPYLGMKHPPRECRPPHPPSSRRRMPPEGPCPSWSSAHCHAGPALTPAACSWPVFLIAPGREARNLPWQGFCSMIQRSTVCGLLTESLRSSVPVPRDRGMGGSDAAAAWLCAHGRGFRAVCSSAGTARPGARPAARLARRTVRRAGRARPVKRATADAGVPDRSCRARPPTISCVRHVRRRLCREEPRGWRGAAVRR
jgi:hypothetical protein